MIQAGGKGYVCQEGILAKGTIEGPDYSGSFIGGEAVGWAVDEGVHSRTNTIYYKFGTGVSSTLKSRVNTAAARWYTEDEVIDISYSATAKGSIEIGSLPDGVNAEFDCITVNAYGHIVLWVIYINSSTTTDTIAHEFGHVIGLTDLYNSSNINKLMYGFSNRTATNPQEQDLWGAKVITGLHTGHTWEYIFYRTNSSGVNQHRRRCSSCKGIKYNSVENCTINGSGYCTKCGHAGNSGTQSITLPEVTGMSLWEEQRRAFRFLIV